MERKTFINLFLSSSVLATITALLYPVIRFMLPPKKKQTSTQKTVAAKKGELVPNSYKIFKFGSEPGILINTPQGELIAFSAVCTHLSCTVVYESDSQIILCPCHNGKFDLAGNVISGPPPKPLQTFQVDISEDNIVVSKRG